MAPAQGWDIPHAFKPQICRLLAVGGEVGPALLGRLAKGIEDADAEGVEPPMLLHHLGQGSDLSAGHQIRHSCGCLDAA
ncbi:hypothetical protein [Streptomyces cahuitamycinicus]|uniref:hypothetical protein n=1 Tax=Streptomyces cahuitamycinicus TaxID=2070367 RepID=UPI0011AECA0C|nr:hypothetical protein [Streptomyces cahuitamycinicus]